MAGYILQSIDPDDLRRLVEDHDAKAISRLTRGLSDGLDAMEHDFEEDDPVAQWPSDRAELAIIAAEHIALDDWYGDLSNEGKTVWITGITHWALTCPSLRFEGQCYWTAVEMAQEIAGKAQAAIHAFGQRPYRYHEPKPTEWSAEHWYPSHSMHLPDEVDRMISELVSWEQQLRDHSEDAAGDLDELMPALRNIASDSRVLLVQIDT